ncbi:MAG: hypothetical protein LAQ69_07140 [Acidobacteriia bacterium]|nr:hypothetical protein [Terriglobia bacterium]
MRSPAASPDVAAHEPTARLRAIQPESAEPARPAVVAIVDEAVHARGRGSCAGGEGRDSAALGGAASSNRIRSSRRRAGTSLAPGARWTSARRGVPSRDHVEECAGGEIPRSRTHMRSPGASPDVAARKPTARRWAIARSSDAVADHEPMRANRGGARRKAAELTAAVGGRGFG